MKEYRYNNVTQANRNRLLWTDPTVDGMKTGYTEKCRLLPDCVGAGAASAACCRSCSAPRPKLSRSRKPEAAQLWLSKL